MDKDKWIEEVLGSADHISPVQAPDMIERILSRASQKQLFTNTSLPQIWSIAASVMLLIALNVGAIYIYSTHSPSKGHSQDAASIFGLDVNGAGQVNIGTEIFGN